MKRSRIVKWCAAALLVLCVAAPALADYTDTPDYVVGPGWGRWWLPFNYSKHGGGIDDLFVGIFWITTVVFFLTEGLLIIFLVKYRHDPNKKKAHFTHGNQRLELAWTIAPAVILALLAFLSKGVWDNYRYAQVDKSRQVQILVVGQQFQWNVVYPGPDGKLGKYLLFPKPTDPKYRSLPYEKAMEKVNEDIGQDNPLGKDENDPNGKDDDYSRLPGRAIIVPAFRPVLIHLTSKDVIHDFFLPNFRVKLDAVPGMHGMIDMEAQTQSTETLSIDDPKLVGKQIWIDPDAQKADNWTGPTAVYDSLNNAYCINDPKNPGTHLAVSLTTTLDAQKIADLKNAGLTTITAVTRPFEVVCEQLCGDGHYTMRDDFIVVSSDQYDRFINKTAAPAAAAAGKAATDGMLAKTGPSPRPSPGVPGEGD